MNILLPIDGSAHSRRAVQFAGRLGSSLGNDLRGIGLLRVITGRYVKSFMPFFDFRSDLLKQAGSFKKFKRSHIDTTVNPSLDDAVRILKKAGISLPIARFTAEGRPSAEIIRVAREQKFSMVIMARRGLSGLKGIVLGSVTNMVAHRATGQTVYIVGQKIPNGKICPIRKILIPVDGSSFSLKAVEHGASLAHALQKFVDSVTLLKVINLTFYEKRMAEKIDGEEEAHKILHEAQQILFRWGIREELVQMKISAGDPAEEILKEVASRNHDTILLGRKGRTSFKNLLLGGVSSTVMQRCADQTLGIISSTEEATAGD